MIFEDNEDPVQANRCKLIFERVSQRTMNSLRKSGCPPALFFTTK